MTLKSTKLTRILLLTAALSFSLPSMAQDENEPAGKLQPYSTTPEQYEQIPSNWGISSVTIVYPGGGDRGVDDMMGTGKKAVLYRDDAEVLDIDLGELANMRLATQNPNALVISFPIQHIPGNYSLFIPDGIIRMAEDAGIVDPSAGDETEPVDPIALINGAFTLNFEIVESPDFSFTPVPGAVKPEQLYTVTITYPEDATISAGQAGNKPQLIFHKGTHSDVEDGDIYLSPYDMSFEKNRVILNIADQESVIPTMGNFSANWDYIDIPGDCWVVNLNGKSYPTPNMKLEKYSVSATASADFKISPDPEDKDVFQPSDLRTLTLEYPETWTPRADTKVGNIIGYLRQTGIGESNAASIEGYLAGTYIIRSVDKESRLITFSLEQSDGTGYTNNTALFETSYYSVTLNAKLFMNNKNQSSNEFGYPGYMVRGKDSIAPLNVSVENVNSVDGLNVVSPSVGFTKAVIEWPFDLNINNGNAMITITRNGETVYEAKASSVFSSGIGNKEMSISFGRVAIRTAGDYTLSIPAGTYIQKSYCNYPSEEIVYSFVIPGNPSMSAYPEAGTSETEPSALPEIDEFSINYPEGTTISLPSSFSHERITLSLKNIKTGQAEKTFHPAEVTVNGPSVAVIFAEPVEFAVNPEEYVYNLNIPASIWNLRRLNVNSSNTAFDGYYTIEVPKAGEISTADGLPIPADYDPSVIRYTSPVQPIIGIVENSAKAYLIKSDSPLRDATGEIIEYSAGVVDEYTVEFRSDTPLDNIEGNFEFVIPSDGPINYEFLGNKSPQLSFPIRVEHSSGVGTLDVATVTVCTIDGKILMRNVDRNELGKLPAGLYIVNNRKLIIK